MSQLITPFRTVSGDGTTLPSFTVLRPFTFNGVNLAKGDAFQGVGVSPVRTRQLYEQRRIGLIAPGAPNTPELKTASITSNLVTTTQASKRRGWKNRTSNTDQPLS